LGLGLRPGEVGSVARSLIRARARAHRPREQAERPAAVGRWPGARSPDERQRAHDFLSNILPMSERSQGLLNDGRFLTKPLSIAFERIKAPVLIVSLEDDYYRTLTVARVLAGKIPGSRLLTYPSGGHIWVGRDAELFAAVEAFIRQN